MKNFHSIIIALILVVFVGMDGYSQCTGTISATGTSPTFTFSSTNPSGNWQFHYWDFGDGNNGIGQTINHTYSYNGTYAVIGYYTDSINGCLDQDTLLLTVTNAATCNASFTYWGTMPSYNFVPAVVSANYTYSWDFGDGFTSSNATPNHVYQANGVYTVMLTVVDTSNNCQDSTTTSIAISSYVGCSAAFNASSNGFATYYFSLSSYTPSYSVYWTFGDGNSSNSPWPTHTYNAPGTYNVTCIVQDSGCSDTVTVPVTVTTMPSCSAVYTHSTNNLTATFNSTFFSWSTAFTWDFGDGSTGSGNTATHTYSTAGSYYVCLTTYDSMQNCTDTWCDTIVVSTTPPPTSGTIVGYVQMGNIPADYGVAFLIAYDSAAGTLSAIDTAVLDTNAMYAFYQVPLGSYYVKAALSPASSNYWNYLPTYYAQPVSGNIGGQLLWSNADMVVLNSSSSMGNDINLVAGNNPGGSAFVSGLVSQGANKTDAEGDPMSDILIIITDLAGNPVAYDYSDHTGAFTIDDLPAGDYVVYPEVYGKTTTPITVTLGSGGVNNIRIEVNKTTVIASIATGIAPITNAHAITVYPNPVQDFVRVDFADENVGQVTITILDVRGSAVVYTENTTGNGVITIPTESLLPGLYLLKVSSESGDSIMKFVK